MLTFVVDSDAGKITADWYSSKCAGVAQLVEHNVANVVVVGSNPIARSLLPVLPFFVSWAFSRRDYFAEVYLLQYVKVRASPRTEPSSVF
jgi:hypothetical protein